VAPSLLRASSSVIGHAATLRRATGGADEPAYYSPGRSRKSRPEATTVRRPAGRLASFRGACGGTLPAAGRSEPARRRRRAPRARSRPEARDGVPVRRVHAADEQRASSPIAASRSHPPGEASAKRRAPRRLELVPSERFELGDHDAYLQVRKQQCFAACAPLKPQCSVAWEAVVSPVVVQLGSQVRGARPLPLTEAKRSPCPASAPPTRACRRRRSAVGSGRHAAKETAIQCVGAWLTLRSFQAVHDKPRSAVARALRPA
jgi:hypothetical protein